MTRLAQHRIDMHLNKALIAIVDGIKAVLDLHLQVLNTAQNLRRRLTLQRVQVVDQPGSLSFVLGQQCAGNAAQGRSR